MAVLVEKNLNSLLKKLNYGAKSFLSASLGSVGVRLVALGLSFVVTVIIARLTTPDVLGFYFLLMSLLSIAQIIAMLGGERWIMRETAAAFSRKEYRSVRLLRNQGFGIVLLAGIIVGVMSWVATSVIDIATTSTTVAVGITTLILVPILSLIGVLQGYLRGLQYAVKSQIPNEIVRPIIFLVIVFSVSIVFGQVITANWLIGAQLCAVIVVLSLLMVMGFRITPHDLDGGGPILWESWARAAIPLMGISLVSQGNVHFLNLLLGSLSGPDDVAFFSICKRLADFTTFAQAAITIPLAPIVAKAYQSGRADELRQHAFLAVGAATISAMPIVLAIVLFPEFFLGFFGREYIAASNILQMLAVAQALTVTLGPVAVWLTMTGHERHAFFSALLGTCTTLVVAIFTIPDIGPLGAAFADVAGLFVAQLAMTVVIFRKLELNPTLFVPSKIKAIFAQK